MTNSDFNPRTNPKVYVGILLFTLLLGFIVSSSDVTAGPAIETSLNDDGLAALRYADHPLLVSGAVRIQQIKMTGKYRDPQEEIDPASLDDALPDESQYMDMRDYRDDREFRDGDTTPNKESFDSDGRVLKQTYDWGRLIVRYEPGTDRLDMHVTVENDSDEVIEQMKVQLLQFNPPGKNLKPHGIPQGRWWVKGRGYHYIARTGANIGAPRIRLLSFDGGQVALFTPSPARPLSYRFAPAQSEGFAVQVDAGHTPHLKREVYDREFNVRPIRPRSKDTYTITLRFAPPDADALDLASDALRYYRETKYPFMLEWPDRRPLGAMFIAGKALVSKDNPNGYRGLSRNWSISDDDALERFREAMIKSAQESADKLVRLGYQGIIVWNLSGEQFQSAKYYGEPRLVEYIAPEMNQVVDDYFRILREHGLRIGLTIRPLIHWPSDGAKNRVQWDEIEKLQKQQHGPPQPSRGPSAAYREGFETYLHPSEQYSTLARLHRKISYAKKRWGVSIFYIDYPAVWRPKKPNNWESLEISPRVYRTLRELHPEVLLIPEDGILASWSATAPYNKVPEHGQWTPDAVSKVYPEAFSALSMPKSWKVIEQTSQAERYKQALRGGDIAMARNQYSLKETARYLGPILRDASYVIKLHSAQKMTLQSNNMEEPIALDEGPPQLEKVLTKHISPQKSTVSRRVRIEFAQGVSPSFIRETADSVGSAGGIVAWSEPMGSENNDK